MKRTLEIAGRPVSVCAPDGGCDTVIYAHLAGVGAERVWRPHGRAALVDIGGVDWDRELSPWPAPRAFRGGEDFAGGADAYLAVLTGEVIPRAEALLGVTDARRGIVGYSLAGLFAVYALCRTEAFRMAASVSGSLWYDGFAAWLARQTPRVPERVYFSVGDREKRTRSARMAAVEDCTAAAEAYFRRLGARTVFERNPGGHFDGEDERLAKGIGWLLSA